MSPTTSSRLAQRARAAEQRKKTAAKVSEGSGFESVLKRRLTSRSQMAYYRENPAAWARDRLKAHLWSKQVEIAALLLTHPRVAVQSAHGVGKSFTAALLACWWIDTHPPGQAMVISTAPSYNQVHTILWEEIRGFHQRASLDGHVRQDDHWISGAGKEVGFGRRPAEHNRSAFQGIHRRYVLVLIDEACGVPEWLWTSAEAMTTGADDRILAIGNPDDNASHFAHVCLRDGGWKTVTISAYDSPNLTNEPMPHPRPPLVTAGWVQDKLDRWGEANPLYQSKVLGEFADNDSGVIPMSWVYQAMLRWHRWADQGRPEPAGIRWISCDVARFGTDRTAIATRQGDVVLDVEWWSQRDSVAVTGLVEARLDYPRAQAIVDAEGIGGPVVDQLRHDGFSVVPFAAGEPTTCRDIAGVMGFPNVRSAMWWNARELLDPYRNPTLALPPTAEDVLMGELCAPTWDVRAGNQIVVETKADLRKRTGWSPDLADSVLMGLFIDQLSYQAPSGDSLGQLTPLPYAPLPGMPGPGGERRRRRPGPPS